MKPLRRCLRSNNMTSFPIKHTTIDDCVRAIGFLQLLSPLAM